MRRFISVLVLCLVTILFSAEARAQTRSETLKAAKDLLEWLEEAKEADEELKKQSRKAADLRARIERARNDPGFLTGEDLATVYVDITMLIPEAVGLPSEIQKSVRVLASGISRILGWAVDFSMEVERRRFRDQMKLLAGDTSLPTQHEKAWAAARNAAHTRQVQLRLLLEWSLEKARMRQVALGSPQPAAPPKQDKEETEIRRGRAAAEKRCFPQFGIKSPNELVDGRNEALRSLQKHYPRTKPFPPEYGDDLSANEEIDWSRKRHQRWRTEKLQPRKEQVEKLKREFAEIEQQFEKHRRGQLKLRAAEQAELNLKRQRTESQLRHESSALAQLQRRDSETMQAFRSVTQATNQMRSYDTCLRQHIENLARQLDWSMVVVRRVNSDLYR